MTTPNGTDCFNNRTLVFVLRQPILIGWDWKVAFNILLCEQNYFLIVWLTGMQMSHVTCM